MDEYRCNSCTKTFSTRSSLTQHRRRLHEVRFSCSYCKYSSGQKCDLTKHIKRRHSEGCSNEVVKKLNCILCYDYPCEGREEMIQHYVEQHDISLEEKHLKFKDAAEFERWKRKIEQDNSSRFVVAQCRLQRIRSRIRYYRCFRDGEFRSQGKGVRNLKQKGSNKINGVCPAAMKMVENRATGAVDVTYVPVHVGHSEELTRLTLTKEERAEIARKLAGQVPFETVIDQIRSSAGDKDVKRIHLITKKDLWNVQVSYGLGKRSSGFIPSDRESLEACIKLMKQESDVVRFYKAQCALMPTNPELEENDLVLIIATGAQLEMLALHGRNTICIDGVQEPSANYFRLTSLMVLDERRQAIPCAFMFSNRSDTDVMALFAEVIRKSLNAPLQTEIMMSDVFYNGWCRIMPKPKNFLFSAWHVKDAWRNNIERIAAPRQRQQVLKMLTALLHETDVDAFKEALQNAVENIENDPGTSEFADYFKEYYVNSVESWAFCYRKFCAINTDNHFESMHKVMKHIYLDGKNGRRLDKAISSLLQMVRDKCLNQHLTLSTLIKNNGRAVAMKNAAVNRRHKLSLERPCLVLSYDNLGWLVSSQDGQDIYFVRSMEVSCDCNIRCFECEICWHDFRCECVDSMVNSNICKHIHCVSAFIKTDFSAPVQTYPDELQVAVGHLIVAEAAGVNPANVIAEKILRDDALSVEELNERKEKLRKKVEEILDEVSTHQQFEIFWNALSLTASTIQSYSR